MLFSKLCNLRRWGALTCILTFSLALSACGDDGSANNGIADAGPDGFEHDAGQHDSGQHDSGQHDSGQHDSGQHDSGTHEDAHSTDDAGAELIEVEGTYSTQFDSTETITPEMWNDHPIEDYDNADNWAVTYTPTSAEYNPDTYTKLVWTEPDAEGAFYYCLVDFGLDTVEAARTTSETADDTDPANSGCGGFSWTRMTPQ